ncbi:hypothetical protein D9M68_775600 [compost metagenome]
MHDDAVGAHGPAFLGVAEPQVEQRPRRTGGAAGLGVVEGELGVVQRGQQRLVIRRGGAGALQPLDLALGPGQHHAVDVAAVELLAPALAAIVAVQDHAVMADGPATARVDEVHGRQQQVCRHPGLADVAIGIAQQHMATAAHHDLALAQRLDVGERPLRRHRRGSRRAFQTVGQGSVRQRGQGAAQADQQGKRGESNCLHQGLLNKKGGFRSCTIRLQKPRSCSLQAVNGAASLWSGD